MSIGSFLLLLQIFWLRLFLFYQVICYRNKYLNRSRTIFPPHVWIWANNRRTRYVLEGESINTYHLRRNLPRFSNPSVTCCVHPKKANRQEGSAKESVDGRPSNHQSHHHHSLQKRQYALAVWLAGCVEICLRSPQPLSSLRGDVLGLKFTATIRPAVARCQVQR